jgi:predicted metalloprotease
MKGVVVETEHRRDVIEAFWLLTSPRVRHMRAPFWRLESADKRHRAKLPENPANITLSGQKGLLING